MRQATTDALDGGAVAVGDSGTAPAGERPVLSPYDLATLLNQLPPTEEQAAIISSPLEPLLVIAGAGSGKTTTMADRVVWLVANGLVLPEEILGVTFTRKAAGELAARIRRQLAKLAALAKTGAVELAPAAAAQDALEPKVSTYHSYASGIVTDYGLRLGVERDAVVLGSAEAWQLASTVVQGYEGDHEHFTAAKSSLVKGVMAMAGECAEHLQDPTAVHAMVDSLAETLVGMPYVEGTTKAPTAAAQKLANVFRTRGSVAAMVERYATAKRNRNALDFGDLVALAARIADEVPQAAALERQRYKVVLLDEFQDTSHAQLALFSKLFGDGHPVTAVGDPHQSIYGFRGASAGQLFRFPEIFLKAGGGYASTAQLTIAWRNSARILRTANVMSGQLNAAAALRAAERREAGPRITVSPLAQRPQAPDGEVVLARYATVEDECAAVAEDVLARKRFGVDLVGGDLTTVAVLCRRRAQFEPLAVAFEARGIPYEIVGLGGLMATPEIVDLVATLRVLADPGRSDALMRLLTGARWRIGPADLMAFAEWSRHLAKRRAYAVRDRVVFDPQADDADGADGGTPVEQDMVDGSSLVEALDYLSPDHWPASLSRTLTPVARKRLIALRDELRMLRGFVGDDLTNLLGEVERTMLLDIELAAKPHFTIHQARRNLDAFQDAAAGFMQAAERVDLLAFLGWLETAEAQEGGLAMTAPEPNPDAVQLLTVHASKGLEWDVVYVPGLNQGAFPSAAADRWSTGAGQLPWPLRGDRADLPAWDLSGDDQKSWVDSEKLFAEDVKAHAEEEERRLAYVAYTRAKDALLCSTTIWSPGRASFTEVSPFLASLLPLASEPDAPVRIAQWLEDPAEDEKNPLSLANQSARWPYDPLEGPEIVGRTAGARHAGRRANADRSAAAVLDELAGLADTPAPGSQTSAADHHDAGLAKANPKWGAETALLLAQTRLDTSTVSVELPPHISASMLVALRDDPEAVTKNLRRPVPRKPGMAARKGTAFHAWVEEYFGTTGQLDLDELPGADAYVDEAYGLEQLRETFKASAWADRTPAALEVPVETRVADVVVRGRIDAVFRDDDGGWDLIDWKTGAPPSKAQLDVRAVQLAVYRLAWARLKDVPLDSVRAAFYFVGQDALIRPHDLAGEAELEAIVTGAYKI
ncbi:ATP-dependent helicase [Arthrobacter sp. 35W]|uniref:ATP-dependent helicase n=1 Tax=Arthrobacter sp. 35W TaxID=1132441 RepID=UPI0003FFD7F4|nr:ATP-dependent DNA helicase [Arthrobacter sp. 35W]